MESGHHGECHTWYCREGRQHDRAGLGLTRLCACSLRSDGPRPHIEGSVERRHKLPSLMLLSALASSAWVCRGAWTRVTLATLTIYDSPSEDVHASRGAIRIPNPGVLRRDLRVHANTG
jgi:hypothetical protein